MSPGIIRTPEGVYVLENDSHLSRWAEENRRLDVAHLELAKFEKFIPVGGTVVDAGASLGDHTLTYAKFVGPNGNVFSFEPQSLSFECLTLNFRNWTNVHLANIALSDRFRKCSIHAEPNVGASYLDYGIEGNTICQPLDVWHLEMTRCDFIHLDAEGSELAAMKGAAKIISQFRPVMLLEIAQWVLDRNGLRESDVTGYLDSIGYRWENAEPGYGPEYPQRDILCIPK